MIRVKSIKQKLLRYLGTGLCLLWLVTALVSSAVVSHEINEAGDIQMEILAKTILKTTSGNNAVSHYSLPQADAFPDAREMGFSLWDNEGRLLASNLKNPEQRIGNDKNGFDNNGRWWQASAYRTLYIKDNRSGMAVAVSVSRRERL